MKTSLTITALVLAATGLSQAAISFTGTIGSGFGVATVPVGTLVMLVADDTSNGFLGTPSFAGDLSAGNDPAIALANASTTVGGRFGGDIILGKLSVTSAGNLPGGFAFENGAALQGKGFAVYYFPTLTTSSASVPDGTQYGITRGSDWILPNVNGGDLFTISATAATYADPGVFARVTVAAGAATNDIFTTSNSQT